MSHVHEVKDNDKRFVINPDTRVARASTRVVVAWMDHNSEYITFEIPRYIESHDITLCNDIKIHYRNYGDDGEKLGVYTVTDLDQDPASEKKLLFTWLISQNATSLIGRIEFTINFQCLDGSEILYSWSTVSCDSIVVSESLRNTEEIVEQYADVLEQWKIELKESGGPDVVVTPEDVDKAVKEYLAENPIDVANTVKYTKQELTDEEKAQARENIGIDEIDVDIESIDAEKVYFSEDLLTTTPIGNITLDNGQATIPAKDKNLKQVWDSIFVKEKNPSIAQPYVSLSVLEVGNYEVGTKISPTYNASLNPGTYTYGPATGVAATSWEVTDSDGNTSTSESGTFPQITVDDDTSYNVTAKAHHTEGSIPLTNLGNEYTSGKISAGTKSKTSGQIKGYRNTFYGTKAEKSAITSNLVRSLTGKSGKSLANGATFDVSIPVGALRVLFAYPATLRDITSIKDQNGLNAEISSSFVKQIVAVEGTDNFEAIDYKVYMLDFANANDTANVFEVTI